MSNEKLDQILRYLEEILKWVKFQGWQNVKNILLNILTDDISKLIYHYSNGASSREIAKKLPVSHKTVTKYWKKWSKVGIVRPIKVKGGGTRYIKIFELEDFGIEIPEIGKVKEEKRKETLNKTTSREVKMDE